MQEYNYYCFNFAVLIITIGKPAKVVVPQKENLRIKRGERVMTIMKNYYSIKSFASM